MEGGTSNIEPTWRVDGQLSIDKVMIPFTLQHWGTKERKGDVDERCQSKNKKSLVLIALVLIRSILWRTQRAVDGCCSRWSFKVTQAVVSSCRLNV